MCSNDKSSNGESGRFVANGVISGLAIENVNPISIGSENEK